MDAAYTQDVRISAYAEGELLVTLGGEILVSALGDALASAATAMAVRAARKLGVLDEVRNAISATEKQHGQPAGNALRAWVTSPDFEKLPVLAATADATDSDIAEPFLLILRHSGDLGSAEDARVILLTFFTAWKAASLRSESGLFIHDEMEAARLSAARDHIAAQVTTSEARLTDTLTSGVQEILAHIDSLRTASPDVSAIQQPYRDQVNLARHFLHKGQAKVARDMLLELQRSPQFIGLPADVRFSALTNLGVAQLRLGSAEEGAAILNAALTLKPSDPVALSNASAAALRLDRFDDALDLARRAFAADEKEPRARINLVAALRLAGEHEEIEQLLATAPDWPDDPMVLIAAAEMFVSVGRLDEAEAAARRAVTQAPNDPAALGLLAATILEMRRPGLRRLAEAQLVEADELLSKAISIAHEHDDRGTAAHLLTNRAALRGMQGRLSEGIADATQALMFEPSNENAHLNKGLFHVQQGQFESAIAELSQLAGDEVKRTARVPLGIAALETQNYELVFETLSAAIDAPKDRDFSDAADLMLRAAEQAGNKSVIDDILERLHSIHATHKITAVPLANREARLGRVDEALRRLVEARASATGEDHLHLTFELAMTYFAAERHAEAAAVFSTFVDERTDRVVQERFLIALLNSGDWKGALTWARKLRGTGPVLRIISEIEARVLDALGDAAGARTLYQQLAAAFPSNVRFRLREIASDIRLNNVAEARTKIQSVTEDSLDGDPDNLMTVASIRDTLGMGGVMPLAYRALRNGYERDDIQSAYIGFFLRHDDEITEPEYVVPDSAVTLDVEDGTTSYIITSDPNEAKQEGYFGTASAVGRKLLGHRIDDVVTLHSTALGKDKTARVIAIRSKYAATFTRLLKEFGVRFPDSKSIQVGDADPEGIIEVIRAADRRRKEIEKLYASGVVGLGGLAELLSRSEIETLGVLTSDAASRVMAFTGEASRAADEDSAVSKATELTFDITALLTIHLLGIQDDVEKEFPRRSVSTHALDVLNQFLATERPSRDEGIGLGVVDDHVVASDITAEQNNARLAFVEQVRAFVTGTHMAAATRAVELTAQVRERTIRRVGTAGLGGIAVAAERGSVLCVDDLVAAQIAHSEWGVRTASSMTLLAHLRRRRIISDDRFTEALSKLASFNYFFLRFTGDDLYAALAAGELSITPSVARLLANLAGPHADTNAAAAVLATFIQRAVLTLNIPHVRAMVIDLAANAMMRGRDPAHAIATLRRALASVFVLIPQQLREVSHTLDLWERRAWLSG